MSDKGTAAIADAADGGAGGNASSIQLDSMSLEELHQLQQQEESRLQAFGGRAAALRQALGRIHRGLSALSELGVAQEGREAMVPLTESVYVRGTIRDPNRLLVDLGTGYYAEKSHKDAAAFLERKRHLVERNLENINTALQATRQNLEAISVTMQGKILEIRAKQEGARHRATVENS